MSIEPGFEAVEAYIAGLKWSDDTPDIHKTLVAGNIRAFAALQRACGQVSRQEFIDAMVATANEEEIETNSGIELLHAIRVLQDADCLEAIREPAGKLWDALVHGNSQ